MQESTHLFHPKNCFCQIPSEEMRKWVIERYIKNRPTIELLNSVVDVHDKEVISAVALSDADDITLQKMMGDVNLPEHHILHCREQVKKLIREIKQENSEPNNQQDKNSVKSHDKGKGLDPNSIKITLFRWAGRWGPFQVKVPCGECALTKDVILDTIESELKGVPVTLELRDWLSEWWRPLLKGGWHAPIVMVEGKVINQGNAMNRGLLSQAVIEACTLKAGVGGNHIFGKKNCPHCIRAKSHLEKANIDFEYHDVISSPRALYEMLARVKPLIPANVPVTVPQIWIDGEYIGGADQLSSIVHQKVDPNYERGQCSLSKKNQA